MPNLNNKLEQQHKLCGVRLENEANLIISTRLISMVNNRLKFRFSDIKIEVALEKVGVV